MVLLSRRAIATVHPVHLVNVERRQAAPTLTPSQTTWAVSPPVQAARVYTHQRATITIYYYYSARKVILILPSH